MAMSLLLATAATSYAQDYDFEVVIDGHTTVGTVTLTASDVAYDGQTHLVGVSNTISNSYLINEEGLPTNYNDNINYQETYVGDKISIAPAEYEKQGAGGSWQLISGEPKDAGTYRATVKVHLYRETVTDRGSSYTSERYRHAFSKTEIQRATATFTINPKTVTVTWSDLEKTYNGSDQFPTAKLSGVISGDNVSVQIVDADGYPYEGNTHKNAGQYKDYAALTGTGAGNYVLDTDSWTNFTIKPKELTVSWMTAATGGTEFDEEITYDGQNHLPVPVVEGAIGSETITAVAANKTGVPYDTPENPDKTHIDHGTYTVYAKITAGEGAYASNYVIPRSSFTYKINKLKAELDWFRPIYDNKTGEVVGTDLQKVKEDTVIGMVYNAKEQKPTVAITNLCTRADTGAKDVVKIVVEVREGKHPVEVGEYYVSAVIVSGSGASNYTLEDAKNVERDFAIIPRPVVLEWGYMPYRDASEDEAIYRDAEDKVFTVDPASTDPKYNYKITYDGKQHSPVARIMNLAKDDNGDLDENYVTDITVTSAKNFDGDAITDQRMFYDAGKYDLLPERLKDQKNYSYYILQQENGDAATGAIGKSTTKVDKYSPVEFTIKQLSAILEWKPLEFKYYNGQVQKPEGTVTNLQEDEDGNEDFCEIVDKTYLNGAEDPSVDANIVTGGAYEKYTIKAEDLVNRNYSLKKTPNEGSDEGGDIETISKKYTIYPLPVEIKWVPDRTEFTYNASMVYHNAQIMNIQKPDAEATGRESDDVILVFSDGSVLNEANAGSYTATIVALGGKDPEENQATNYSLLAKPELLDESGRVPNLVRNWKINKKALTVTVDDKAISYGDDPAAVKYTVRYSGLVNGDTNKDDNHNNTNVPGKYTPTGGEEKDVVEGTPKFTRNYNKWGKPGKYTIGVSGLSSDNYSITYKAGTLTVYDKVTALLAKAKAGSKKGTLYWNGVTGAAKYDIYYSHCNTPKKTFTPKYYKTVSGNKTSTKIKKLKKRNFYKFYVVAFDSSGKQIAQSDLSHFCTNNVSGKYTNPKSITPSAKTVNVSKGGTFKLSAKVKKVKKGKKLVNGIHTSKIRYLSETPAVATVTQDGTITGVASGWCRVHVLAANGIWQTVEVYVQ